MELFSSVHFSLQKTLEIAVFQLIKLKPCETEVSKEEMLEQAAILSSRVFKRKLGCYSTKYSVETQEKNSYIVKKIHYVSLMADLRVANFSPISNKGSMVSVKIINTFV